MHYRVNLLILCLCLLTPWSVADPQKIYIAYPEVTNTGDVAFYYQQILKLALDKTRVTDGDFVLEYSNQMLTIDRSIQQVIKGDSADIMWGSATAERKKVLLEIPYDLLRGLNQYRILIIHPDNQKQFLKINRFDEFKQFVSGGADSWTITNILRQNGIDVRTAPYYVSLLKMLSAKRFDYMARGLHEVQGDLELSAQLNLNIAIESSILLEYEHPIRYAFLVGKHNAQLADRVMRGLRMAEEDGSLPALTLFDNTSAFLNQGRRVFVLKNHE